MTGPDPAERPAAPAGVAFGALLAVLAAYQQFKLPPVLPLLTSQYGHDPRVAGGFMSVYALAGLALSPVLGPLIERHGVAAYLQSAFVLFALGGAMALAWPESGVLMLVSRSLEGAGFAVLAIVGPVLVTGNAGRRYLPLAIGLAATWIPIGQLIANIAARPILAAGDWKLLWWGGLAGTLAMAAWTLLRGLGAGHAGDRLWRTGTTAANGAGGRTRRVLLWAAAVLFCLWSTQFIAYMTWLPSYLVSVHGLDPSAAVLGYAVPIVTLLVFNLLTGWAMTRGVRIGPLLTSALAGQAAVWALLPVTGGGWSGIVSLVVYGIGAGIVPTCLFGLPNAIEGAGRPGAFATLMTGRNLGVLIGPLLLGWVFSVTADWNSAGPVFAGSTLLAVALSAMVARTLRRQSAANPG